jgi:hypothetical protein
LIKAFCGGGRNLGRRWTGCPFVQLSPKSVFFGLLAFGLPIAVTIGWTLAAPARRPSAASVPGGAGGIGAAPERVETAEPVTAVRYSSGPYRPPAASAATSASPPPTTPPTTTSASPAAPPPAAPASGPATLVPPLILPPVPTPTEITTVPGPSESPSGDPSAGPSTAS